MTPRNILATMPPSQPRKSPSKVHWAAKRLGAIAVGALLAVIAGETAIRVLPLDIPPGITGTVSLHDLREVTAYHPQLGYALAPDLVDRELATTEFHVFLASTTRPDPEADVGFRDNFDIENAWAVVMGDSFAMGWGVNDDETFASLTEKSIGQRVLNFGVAGWGPYQALAALEQFALRYQPKVVIWAFYPNDFDDACYYADWEGKRHMLVEKSTFHLLLNSHCALYKLYRYLAAPRSRNAYVWNDGDLSYVFAHSWQGMVDGRHERVQRGLKLSKKVLDRVAELSSEHGFRTVFLSIPFREHVYYDQYATTTDREVAPLDVLEQSSLDMLAYAKILGFGTLDALPALREHAGEQIYFRHDCHLTPTGNAVVGELLTTYLRDHTPPR